MSEPSTNIPADVADAQVDETAAAPQTEEKVELNLDEDKLEAWDEVKSDYQVDPDAGEDAEGAGEDAGEDAEGGSRDEADSESTDG